MNHRKQPFWCLHQCFCDYFVFWLPLSPVPCCRWSSPSSLGCQGAVPVTCVLSLSLLPRSTGGWCSSVYPDYQNTAWHEGKKDYHCFTCVFLNLISDCQGDLPLNVCIKGHFLFFWQKNSTDFFVAYSMWWRASIYSFVVILKCFFLCFFFLRKDCSNSPCHSIVFDLAWFEVQSGHLLFGNEINLL